MTRCRQALMAAVASSFCAAIWLVNCVVDVVLPIGSLMQDAFLTAVWAACAVCWWMRWRHERRAAGLGWRGDA